MEFSFEMQHSKETFKKLSHMQYDLFCKSNLITRNVLGFVCLVTGATNLEAWWGVLLGVYGYYLISSRYASSDHTVKKLVKGLENSNTPYPASRFCFYDDRMDIVPLPEGSGETSSLPYSEFFCLAEDRDHFYIFRNQFGGYMIPREQVGGDDPVFRRLLREKTGLDIKKKTAPVMRVANELRLFFNRRNDPPHL